MRLINSSVAKFICEHAALKRKLAPEHAKWFANGLIETSLMGIDTHGIRLLSLYLRELDEGRSNPVPQIKTIQQKGSIIALDADGALGTIAGTYAAKQAVEIARKNGISAVSIANSNHFGAASIYGLEIAKEGMIGIVTTSAAARMAPYNGKVPIFGTNPICFSAPASNGKYYLFDMATSQVSYSQVKNYKKNNKELPLGWVLDKNGKPTTQAHEAVSLSPLGGYKGQGLAMMVQILSCLLSSMPLDNKLEHLDTGSFNISRNIGHFMIAIDISSFLDSSDFHEALTNLMNMVRETPSVENESVFVAGDIQEEIKNKRLILGIPASNEEIKTLLNEAKLIKFKEIDKLFKI